MSDKQQLAAMGEHLAEQKPLCMAKRIEELEAQVRALTLPEGWQLVPLNPTEDQWGGLARAIVFWMRSYPSNQHTPRTMVDFITSLGHTVPGWMDEEGELKAQDHVMSKGTVAVLIYKAMLAAAPSPDSAK